MENKDIGLKSLAHLGDAVYELFIREKVVFLTNKSVDLHRRTTKFVCADFQADLFDKVQDFLTVEELEILRRGRNLSLSQCKRSNQSHHRKATAFEVIVGYFYINDKNRLNEFFDHISGFIIFEDSV